MSRDDEREIWLRDLLRYGIQHHIYADATADQVADVIAGLDDYDAFDPDVAALVQIPKGVCASEAQEAVDRAFRPSASPVNVEGLVEALRPFAEERTIDEIMADGERSEFLTGTPEERIALIGKRKREHDANIIRARQALASLSPDGER